MDPKDMDRRIAVAFDFVERVLEHPGKYPDEAVLFLMDPAEIASIITKERLHLLRELQAVDYASIAELARSMGRDVSRVRKDLLTLERFDLVQFTKEGNRVHARPAATGIFIPLLPAGHRRALGRGRGSEARRPSGRASARS